MSNYNHFKNEEFLKNARAKFLKESEDESMRKRFAQIEAENAGNVAKARSIATSSDKRLIEASFRINEMTKINPYDVKLSLFTEAICRYIMPAIQIEESYKESIRGTVFHATRKFLKEQMDAVGGKEYFKGLSEKTNLLEDIVDNVDKVYSRLMARRDMSSFTEGNKGKDCKKDCNVTYDKLVDDPVALLSSEEDDLLNPANSDDAIVGASEINELIVGKVLSVIEDEKARAEENELVIQDIKDNIAAASGDMPDASTGEESTDIPSDEEIAEAVLATKRKTFFESLLIESQMEKIDKNINEGLGEEETNSALMEAIIRYTIAETLHTLKVYEPTSRTTY